MNLICSLGHILVSSVNFCQTQKVNILICLTAQQFDSPAVVKWLFFFSNLFLSQVKTNLLLTTVTEHLNGVGQ